MGWNGTWKTKGRPSEARLKFFDETFLQKSFDLALDLHRRAAQERKLGKQRSVFPDRRSAWALNSRCVTARDNSRQGAAAERRACAREWRTSAPGAERSGPVPGLSFRALGVLVPSGDRSALGLRCRVGRCWTSATGRQHPSRQARLAAERRACANR